MSNRAIVHEAQLSRAAQVVRDVMGGHQPMIWLSDGYSAQQGHGHHHQTCLAHLARDVAYALEASDDIVPFRLKLWLDKVFVLARNITGFAASTLKAKKRALENTLAVLAEAGAGPEHIVRMNWYLTDKREYLASIAEVGAIYRELIGKHFPAMSVMEVSALIEDEAKIEIETTSSGASTAGGLRSSA